MGRSDAVIVKWSSTCGGIKDCVSSVTRKLQGRNKQVSELDRRVREVVRRLADKYNVSDDFKDKVSLHIKVILSEFKGDQQAKLLRMAEETFERQAAIEEHVRKMEGASQHLLKAMYHYSKSVDKLYEAKDLLMGLALTLVSKQGQNYEA